MDGLLRSTIADVTGSPVRELQALSGGDINSAYQVNLNDGRRLFVKSNRLSPPGMFQEEARGLRWLAEAKALAIPNVIAVHEDPYPFLLLEYLPATVANNADWELLGRGLARLHSTSADTFGALPDNYIGSLSQDNRSTPTWVEFYWQRRLIPQVSLAMDAGRIPARWSRRFTALEAHLCERLVEPPVPERVHGDLWSGNVVFVSERGPCLIDPAAYAGHGEMDLAMMRLFGGFAPRVFDAYAEVRPLAEGSEERVALYQLYPLLVHVNLFGGGYAAQVERILSQYA